MVLRMQQATVVVIEQGAEAALVCAALTKRPEVRVVEAASLSGALAKLEGVPAQAKLAIAGATALRGGTRELVARLGERGIPVIAVASDISAAARQDALAAGVREIYERPRGWQPYTELIESLVARFVRPG